MEVIIKLRETCIAFVALTLVQFTLALEPVNAQESNRDSVRQGIESNSWNVEYYYAKTVERIRFLDWYQRERLDPGFLPDPWYFSTSNIISGGSIPIECSTGTGYFDSGSSPDFVLEWTGQGPFTIVAEATNDSDLMMYVRPESANFHLCTDDTYGLDPGMTITAGPGIYGIWIGNYGSPNGGTYNLYVTELEFVE